MPIELLFRKYEGGRTAMGTVMRVLDHAYAR